MRDGISLSTLIFVFMMQFEAASVKIDTVKTQLSSYFFGKRTHSGDSNGAFDTKIMRSLIGRKYGPSEFNQYLFLYKGWTYDISGSNTLSDGAESYLSFKSNFGSLLWPF